MKDSNKSDSKISVYDETDDIKHSDENKLNSIKSKNVKKNKEETFHRAIAPVLIMAQCFGVMPVENIRRPDSLHLNFSYRSIQTCVTVLYMGLSSIMLLGQIKHVVNIGINAKNFVGVVFFSNVQCGWFFFFLLAKKWPIVIRFWTETDSIFTSKLYEIPKRNLSSRLRYAAVVTMLLSLLEHAFYLSSAVTSYIHHAKLCPNTLNTTRETNFADFIQQNYDYVFRIVPYSLFFGVYVMVTNFACTFVWNYMDLFIMLISKGIAYRFEQISKRINKLADKEVPEATFTEIREHYVKLCELLDCVDENLSAIILLSCMNNLYFICYQLLNIFNKLRWPINYIYFWYSLLFLMGRTAFVFYTAATINDESKAALGVLRRVPMKSWCEEVERLIYEMTSQTVALSGKKFYFLTRKLLLGMAGTIITYELVLLQLDEPSRKKGLAPLCALKMVQKAYGDSSMSRTQAYKWYKSFKEGREVIKDLPRSGRPSTSNTEENVAKIKKIVLEDRRMTKREIARDLNISNGSVYHILHDILGMRRVGARFVPKHLDFLQKVYRKNVCEEMIFEQGNNSTFMKRIITGDKTRVYEYDVETSQQSSEWCFENELKPKKPRKSRSKIKVMLTVFFDYRGVIHYEFLPEGHTINKEYYLGVMRHLRSPSHIYVIELSEGMMVSRNKLRKIFSKHQPIFGNNTIFKVRNNIYNLNKVHAATRTTIDNNSKDPLETTTTIAEYSISQEKYISNDNINAIEQKDDVSDIFHRAVYPIIIIAQCFGVMPVMGVRHKNPRRMRFSFISMQLLVTLIYFGTTILLLVFMVRHLWFVGIDAKNIGVIFYISAFLAYVLFMLLAARWPKLIRVWARSEMTFNQKPYEILPKNLAVRIRTAATIIIILSAGIAYRFEQITTRINKLAGKEIPEDTFAEIREHYVKVCELLDYVDDNLSGIILLSCANNLYFVCNQLLNVFNKLRWPINYIYFWYSLLYLIGRTAYVFLTAASINDESKAALGVLRRVSKTTWCVEVERLIFQMATQTVALSGKKFYYLTRKLLFGMAGTIVTYELVLLQFDEPNRSKGLAKLCA
ncbi:uncharacterized protein LOC119678365 [Teleopsis dalmanni]|uniref:uncharacterized protein LOC119678365 n=1 Tax=Teleopsis dalmanni TaxID=139649 RepID=UPI0018CEE2A8|nr:uncharacterized protein LOC119678365 [Teleopsis dalmanni]